MDTYIPVLTGYFFEPGSRHRVSTIYALDPNNERMDADFCFDDDINFAFLPRHLIDKLFRLCHSSLVRS